MVTAEGTLNVVHKIGQGLGEFMGGAKLAGQGKQPEKTPTGMGMAGGMGMKALLGTEGFGGLKKTMVGMSGPIGKMGGAMMKGGVIGIATGAITGIMSILSKALGSSSIFTGVAAQFWKIAGVMVDMLLMPLLPYMMKFIQWMMSSVMPQIMKISSAIGKALDGDIGSLLSALGSWYKFIFMDIYARILNGFGRFLLDIIVVAFKNANPLQKDTTLKEYRAERKQKEKKAKEESITGETGTHKEAWAQTKHQAKTDLQNLAKPFVAIGSKVREFVSNMESEADKTETGLTKFVDKEKNTGKSFWSRWSNIMYKFSILPNIKKDTEGFMTNISDESGGVRDFLFGWIGKINWGIFGAIGGKIKDAASAVWGSISGFFTGTGADGEEVSPSIPGILSKLNPLNWFPKLTDFGAGIASFISNAASSAWGAITGFFTGTDSEGKQASPSIPGILSKLNPLNWFPKLLDIDIFGTVWGAATGVWNAIKGFFTGKDGDGKAVSPSITGILPDIPSLGDIISGMGDIAGIIKQKAVDIWNGVKKWFTETLPGMIPGMGSFSKEVEYEMPGGKTITTFTKGSGILGALEKVFGVAMDIAGKVKEFAQKIWDGVKTFFTETLPGKIPSWSEIVDKVKEVWAATTDFAGDVGTSVKEWAKGLWGSWSDKTGIAGIIPNMIDKLKSIDVMGSIGDLFKIQVEGTWSEMGKLQDKFGGTKSYKGKEDGKYIYELELGVGDILKLMGSMVKDQAMRPINWLKEKYNALKTFMAGISLPDLSWSSIKDTLKDMVNLLIGGINKAILWLIEKWNNTIGLIKIPFTDWGFKIDNPESYQIPTWHTGGIVPGGPGSQIPAMLQGGEQVIPRSQRQNQGSGGGTNQVFNISISSTFSPGDIIKSITQSGATDEIAYLNTVG